MKKHSPTRYHFDRVIERLEAGGIIQYLIYKEIPYKAWVDRKLMRENGGKPPPREIATEPFRVEHILAAIFVQIFGLAMSVVIFCSEKLYHVKN